MLIKRFVFASGSLFLTFCVLVLLSACEDRPTSDGINQRAEQSRKSLDRVMVDMPSKHYNPLVVTDKVWAGNAATRMQRGMPLPPRYESSRGITIVSSEPLSLAEIANHVTQQTGISVRVAQTTTIGVSPSGVSSSAASGGLAAGSMPISYEGSLSGLMERVAGYFGVNWKYDGTTIAITRFETKVFTVEVLPGTQKSTSGVQQSSGGSSGGGGGSSGSSGSSSGGSGGSGSSVQSTLSQTSQSTIDIKYWEELSQTLASMLGGVGTVVVSPSLGTVTVTTTPEVMHTVAEYITQQNQRLSRQIAINVEIYTVDLTDGLNFNVAFTAAIKKITSLSTGLSGAAAPSAVNTLTGGGVFNMAIIEPKTFGTVTDVFTALSGIGSTTKVAKFPMITLNNMPVVRRIGTQVSYVQNATTTITGTSGATSTSVTPGQIQEGFTVQMLPRILDDGRILLDYSLDIINLISLGSFNSQCGSASSTSCTAASGSTTVQLPNQTERAFTQQSVLKSGATLIMGGAEEEDLSQNTQGVGDPYNYFLGGGLSSSKKHSMVFFAITPQVIDSPHGEKE